MTPFQVPDGPYSIEKVMDAIRNQVIDPASSPSEGNGATGAVAPSDGKGEQSLSQAITLLTRLLNNPPAYQVQSHRPYIGRLIDPIKRLIHWGARPYADAVRQRQDDWNAMAIDALREARESLSRMQANLDQLRARHDLGPFFSAVAPERRLQALNETRGVYDDIHMRQRIYVDYFRNPPGQVLDVGCGRGELLNMLRLEGIEVWGADIDPLMVRMTQSKGVHAVQADAMSVLKSVARGTLGGVFAAQVVEHFFPGELLNFLLLARDRLAPGGRIVLETLNPASLAVLAKSYCRDIDHKQPIHPEYLKLLVELAGFEEVELHTINPFAPEEIPAALPSAQALGITPEAHAALAERFGRMDALLYGDQDYYVAARQPAAAAESGGA